MTHAPSNPGGRSRGVDRPEGCTKRRQLHASPDVPYPGTIVPISSMCARCNLASVCERLALVKQPVRLCDDFVA